MRLIALLPILLCVFAPPLGGQSEQADPYSIHFVQTALKIQSGGIVVAKVQTNLARRGDEVSIALLKILNDRDLTSPQTVRAFLPIIRQSFSQPQFISIDVNKKPSITLFLLGYLQQKVKDPQTQKEIKETLDFVMEKTKGAYQERN